MWTSWNQLHISEVQHEKCCLCVDELVIWYTDGTFTQSFWVLLSTLNAIDAKPPNISFSSFSTLTFVLVFLSFMYLLFKRVDGCEMLNTFYRFLEQP